MKNLFENYGFLSSGILNVSPREAFELCEKGAIIVDVREPYLNNFKNFEVPEILFIPISELEHKISDLRKRRYLIFADTVGLRSREAVILLKSCGLLNIANMAGGIVDWERDGLPITANVQERLSGSCMCQLKPRETLKMNSGRKKTD